MRYNGVNCEEGDGSVRGFHATNINSVFVLGTGVFFPPSVGLASFVARAVYTLVRKPVPPGKNERWRGTQESTWEKEQSFRRGAVLLSEEGGRLIGESEI